MYFLEGSKGNSNIKKSREILSHDLNARNSRNSHKTYDSLTIGVSHHKVISVNSDHQDFQYVENKYWFIEQYIYIFMQILIFRCKYKRCFWHVYYGDAYYHTFCRDPFFCFPFKCGFLNTLKGLQILTISIFTQADQAGNDWKINPGITGSIEMKDIKSYRSSNHVFLLSLRFFPDMMVRIWGHKCKENMLVVL